MEQVMGDAEEGVQRGGGGEIAIVLGRKDLAAMRGSKEKYNDQQWLMGGGAKGGVRQP